jgi:glutathione S-transferase
VCWDGIDGHACRIRGWVAASRDEPELRITHLRQMGSSHHGVWLGRKRWGRGKYFMGSALGYIMAVAAYRLAERPFVVGGVGILWGYVGAMLRREPRLAQPEYRAAIARFETEALLSGKARTTRRWNARVRARPPKSAAPAPHALDGSSG